jgi:hypothetical protein
MWKLFGAFHCLATTAGNFFPKVFVISSCKSPTDNSFGPQELILKVATYILAVLAVLFCSTALKAQSVNQGTHVVEAKLALKGAEVQGSYLIISYEIPYSGMVEIRLFNEGGQKIWQNQYADTFGKNKIVLKASKFNPGETYAYQLNYKRDEVKEKIVIPPLGFN